MRGTDRLTRTLLLVLVVVGRAEAQEPEGLAELASRGLWDDVIVQASDRLEEQPDDATATYWLGRAWLARAESLLAGSTSGFTRDLAGASLDRAVDRLEQVPPADFADVGEWIQYARFLRGDPTLPEALEDAYARQGDAYAAFLRGRLAQEAEEGDAADWFRRAVEAAPERGDYALALCDQLAREGRADEALEAWRGAEALGVPTDALLPRLMIVLAGADRAARRLDMLDALSRGRDLESDALTAWHRAHALEQTGDPVAAERALAAATVGRTAAVERAHAALLGRLGRHAEALDRLAPRLGGADGDDMTEAALDLADAAAGQGDWDTALRGYDAVLEHVPEHERALRNRALTTWRAGEQEEALTEWRALAKRWPERADVLNDAALFLGAAGHRDEALALWEQALGSGGDEDARENLAVALVGRDPERARRLLGEVLDMDPTRDRALYYVHRTRRTSPR